VSETLTPLISEAKIYARSYHFPMRFLIHLHSILEHTYIRITYDSSSRARSGDTIIRSHTLKIRNQARRTTYASSAAGLRHISACLAIPNMAINNSFHHFSHGHHDLVLAVDYNFYGTRMVTASSDHRLKVWDKKDDGWTVTDVWKAHDAEVTDVSQCYKIASLNIFLTVIRSNGTVPLWARS
jgi:WD40 repeat protein